QVSIIEQDIITPDQAQLSRKGVPQGPHSHFLMLKGITIISKLFPEVEKELLKKGAKKIDIYRDIQLYKGMWLPNLESGKNSFLQSRPLLEDAIRSLVQK